MKNKVVLVVIIVITLFVLLLFLLGDNAYDKVMYPNAKRVGNGSIKISCVGDSITYGLGVLKNREYAWPSVLAKELGKNYQTINYGLSNRTLLSTGDMPYMKEKLAKEFWNSEEDIILFMLGTNDTKAKNWNKDLFEKEYKNIVKKLKKKSKLYIMIPPAVFIKHPGKSEPNYKNLEDGVIPIIKKVGKEENVEVIDLYTITVDHPEWFKDRLHPNREANEKIAKEIAIIIK